MKNQREIYKALLAGEWLVSSFGGFARFNDNNQLVDEVGNRFIEHSFKRPEDWEVYMRPKWYENIPDDGVLCWVSELNEAPLKYPVLIDAYKKDLARPFKNTVYHFPYAGPLTKQEIQVFMDNAPEKI